MRLTTSATRIALFITVFLSILAMPSAWATKPRANDGDKKVEIQSEAPWRKGLEEHESGEDPMRREEEFWKERVYPFDKVPPGALERAIAQQDQMWRRKGGGALLAASPTWKAIGPGNIGGRTRTIVCDPKKDGWVYAGAAGGGIWRTTDRGESWTPIFDYQNSLCMGAMAIDPKNSDILYAATGEIAPASNMHDGWGTGMYKSVDGGKTWRLLGLTTVGAFSKVYVHPKNSNLLYAGGVRTGSGLYRSTDAGASWKRLNRLSVSDISINPNDENELFLGVVGEGVFHTLNGGDSVWKSSAGFPYRVGRVSVQMCGANNKKVYCLIEGPNPADTTQNNKGYVLVSDDNGVTWRTVITADNQIFGDNNQGYYDNFIEAHPTNPDIAYFGGIDFYLTTNGGVNWTNISNSYSGGGVHPDQHACAFNPLNPDEVYIANDGGVYRSANLSSRFEAVNNGYEATAYYAMDIDFTASDKTYGGTQDNGTSGSTGPSIDWRGILGGDGFFVAVSPLDPNIIYCENYNGTVKTVNLSTGRVSQNVAGIPSTDPTGAWSSPIVLDRGTATLYHGRKALYQQAVGSNQWQAFSPALDTGSFVSAIGPSPVDGDHCWAGYESGSLWRTTNGGTNWTGVTINGLPQRYIRDVIPSSVDVKTAWVCYSGYGTGHVYVTRDGGKTWSNISTTLPDIPVNALAVLQSNENVIFAGTDIGVFATFNGGQSWFPFGKGMPRAPVLDMRIYDERNLLRVATHGRSMFEVEIPTEEVDEPGITSPAGGDVVMATSSMVFSWHGFPAGDAVNVDINYNETGNYWYRVASNVLGGSMRWVVENRPTSFAHIRVTSSKNPNLSVVSNTFTILEFTRGSVKEASSFSHVAYGLSYDNNNGLYTTSFYTNDVFKLNATTLQMERTFKMPKGFDNNFTDMAMDRSKGQIYIHRLTQQVAGSSARIAVIDTLGNLVRSMISPASYGIGLEYIDGKLYVGERDGAQQLYVCNPATAAVISQVNNPFNKFYGPRCLSTDGKGMLFQVGTDFGSGGGLQGAYLSKIPVDTLNKESDRMELLNSVGNTINARGIEYDPRDGNYWITDLSGNIFKIANFDTPSDPLSDVQDQNSGNNSGISIAPNPVAGRAVISYMTGKLQAHVKLEVYTILGERVAELVNGVVDADNISAAIWDCREFPEGLYTVSLVVDGVQRPAAKLLIAR
ncbi:MAG: hypothetical protein ACK5JL_00480 [Candidatus Kapaibacterium sp.]|jgi:photosystem II stability/assembly factor-like uncharacterized protein